MLKRQLGLLSFFSRKDKEAESSDGEFELQPEGRASQATEQWTRVKAVHSWKATTVQLFDLEKDIQTDKGKTNLKTFVAANSGRCLFEPDIVTSASNFTSLNDHHLDEEELSRLG